MKPNPPLMTDGLIADVAAFIEAHAPDEEAVRALRGRYPGLHFTACMDDDITVNAKPVLSRPGFKLYLVNTSDHCSVLTNCLESASGMVIAEVLPE